MAGSEDRESMLARLAGIVGITVTGLLVGARLVVPRLVSLVSRLLGQEARVRFLLGAVPGVEVLPHVGEAALFLRTRSHLATLRT